MTDQDTCMYSWRMIPLEKRGVYLPCMTLDYRSNSAFLQYPHWEQWGLAVPVTAGMTWEHFQDLVYLQNMVAGILSHDAEKAALYKSGELHYYTIVEEIEKHVGRKLCGENAGGALEPAA